MSSSDEVGSAKIPEASTDVAVEASSRGESSSGPSKEAAEDSRPEGSPSDHHASDSNVVTPADDSRSSSSDESSSEKETEPADEAASHRGSNDDGEAQAKSGNDDGQSGGRRNRGKRSRRKSSSKRKSAQSGSGDESGQEETNEVSAKESDDGGAQSEGGEGESGKEAGNKQQPKKSRKQRYKERKEKEREKEAAALEAAEPVETEGIVEISPKGFGFLRSPVRNFEQSPKDVFITPEVVRIYGLRDGLWVKCVSKQGLRGPQLIELKEINGCTPEEYVNLPYFEELTAINPDKKLTLETSSSRATTRVIDLITPIGRGQRGLIVAPPRTGKTTLLQHIAEGVRQNYEDEVHLMVLLVDERPEEVTDFQRSFPDVEVFSSSNDSEGKDHTRIAMLAIERAKRLVEAGEHVFILMDSITRLARAFNSEIRGGGKRGTASGGLVVGALEAPRRIFAAARNTREAGSLTIVATALIQTNSKADEAIFQEFKGTGNMELVLDRELAQNLVYPAVDIHKSGTRREELLLAPHVLEKIYVIRRGLAGRKPIDAMEWLLRCMERYPSNAQMLMDIKMTALT